MTSPYLHCTTEDTIPDGLDIRGVCYENYTFPPHYHDFFEMNIVLAGSGTHVLDGHSFSVKAGDVFVIPPQTVHSYRCEKDLTVYHLLWRPGFLQKSADELGRVKGFLQLTEIDPFLRNSTSSFFLHLDHGQKEYLQRDLALIDDDGGYSWEEYPALKYHTAWKVLLWLSDLRYRQSCAGEAFGHRQRKLSVLQALEYIHSHYGEHITVDILCRHVYLTRSTFLRNFQTECGVSPIRYLYQYRCKKAAELLESSDLSKTEIAHCCGFYDLSHMERALKQHL